MCVVFLKKYTARVLKQGDFIIFAEGHINNISYDGKYLCHERDHWILSFSTSIQVLLCSQFLFRKKLNLPEDLQT